MSGVSINADVARSGKYQYPRRLGAPLFATTKGWTPHVTMPLHQKAVFKEIRNFLAGRALGATRDRALLEEVMKCVFAQKKLLLNGGISSEIAADEPALARVYRDHFRQLQSGAHPIFSQCDDILLDSAAIAFVHDRLMQVDLLSMDRDPVGDLYEAFAGASIRGSEGQFFTPENAGRWLVDAIAPSAGERIIDPACGAGGFILWAAQSCEKNSDSLPRIYGIEKDEYLAWLARARTAVLGINATVLCGNSLSFEANGNTLIASDLLRSFDVVLTNPPFGKNISSVSLTAQDTFQLGSSWYLDKDGRYTKSSRIAKKAPPQVLFLERVLSLLRPGGRAGIVVPESLLSSRTYAHVVQFLRDHSEIRAVVGMPESTFKSSGKGGTHTKTCLLFFEKRAHTRRQADTVFMAEAKWCGHDSRGRPIPKDDLPQIAADYASFRRGESMRLGYAVKAAALQDNVLAPRYHEPNVQRATERLIKSHELISVGKLIEDGVLEVSTGNEVGKLAYGTGPIPFVRTSDLSGWEIKIDPKHCVSEEVYQTLKNAQDVRKNDILMVRDGTYLIGTTAIITEYDEKIVYQSHLYKIRCLRSDRISPHLLLAVLSSGPVQRQIRAKTFTQDIIDSLGSRLREIILPIPRLAAVRKKIEETVVKVIEDRVEARELARKAINLVVDPQLR